jgi:chromodomain-helicase-DNA-binding protein 1
VTNYNEEGEDEFEESENDMTPSYWAAAEEDSGPIIDKILDHRPRDGTGLSIKSSTMAYILTISRA